MDVTADDISVALEKTIRRIPLELDISTELKQVKFGSLETLFPFPVIVLVPEEKGNDVVETR